MIRAELRFKNASFINALEKTGYKSIAEFARQSGINYQLLIEYANLRYLFKKPEIIKKMVGLLENDEWTLFEQYREVIEKNNGVNTKMTTDIPTEKLISLTSEKLLQLKEPKDIDHDMIYHESLKIDTEKALEELTIRERQMIRMYFGIGIGGESLSHNEIAREYNLSKERVGQIIQKAIRRLKHYSRSDKLKQYLNGQ
jgi:RNA polymerase sigma factor (sigma-70 family)